MLPHHRMFLSGCAVSTHLIFSVYTTHFQVGTVDPVGDFRAIISRRDEDKFDEGGCPVNTGDVFKTL